MKKLHHPNFDRILFNEKLRETFKKICPNCQKDFWTNRKNGRFCSSYCCISFSNSYHYSGNKTENEITFERFKRILYKKAIENRYKNPISIENITQITGMESGSRERYREIIRIRDNHTC